MRKPREEMIAETRAKLIAAGRHAFGTVGYAGVEADDADQEDQDELDDPAQNPAREAIHDHSQVAPLASDFEVSDIANPELVDFGDGLTSDGVGHRAVEI